MNNRTETLKLIISGDGKLLGAELGRGEQHVRRYTNRIQDHFGRMNRAIGSRMKSMLTNPLAIIGGTAGLLYAGKQVIDYQDKLSTMGINAGLTASQLMALDQEIYKNAYVTGQSRDKILDAMIDIYDKTGDFKFVENAIGGVAKSSTAMSAEIFDSARILSAMKLGMGATAGEAESLFDILARMGNIGSFPFAQQAQQAERLFASTTLALGITKKNFSEYAAFIQSVKPVFGTGDIAATAIERIMMDLATKRKEVQKAVGFKLFDEKGAIIDFQKTIRALARLDITKRARIFGEFGRAFIPLASDEGIKIFERYIAEGQRAGFIADAFNKKQGEAKYQMNALATAAQQFADVGLTPVIADLTKGLSEMTKDPEKMAAFTADIVAIARALGIIGRAVGAVSIGWGRIFGAANYLGENLEQVRQAGKYSTYRMREDAIKSNLRYSPEMKSVLLRRLRDERPFVLPEKDESVRDFIKRAPMWEENNPARRANAPAPVSVAAPDVKNSINMTVTIPESGPVIVSSNDPNTTATVKTNRGSFK